MSVYFEDFFASNPKKRFDVLCDDFASRRVGRKTKTRSFFTSLFARRKNPFSCVKSGRGIQAHWRTDLSEWFESFTPVAKTKSSQQHGTWKGRREGETHFQSRTRVFRPRFVISAEQPGKSRCCLPCHGGCWFCCHPPRFAAPGQCEHDVDRRPCFFGVSLQSRHIFMLSATSLTVSKNYWFFAAIKPAVGS